MLTTFPRNNWLVFPGRPTKAACRDGLGSDFSGDADLPRANLFPRYLKRGIATIPDFLEERYEKRRVLSSTSASSLPPASAFSDCSLLRRVGAQQPVSRRGILQISHGAAIWLLVILLGLAGFCMR